jgi:hypothetical protein
MIPFSFMLPSNIPASFYHIFDHTEGRATFAVTSYKLIVFAADFNHPDPSLAHLKATSVINVNALFAPEEGL